MKTTTIDNGSLCCIMKLKLVNWFSGKYCRGTSEGVSLVGNL